MVKISVTKKIKKNKKLVIIRDITINIIFGFLNEFVKKLVKNTDIKSLKSLLAFLRQTNL